MVPKAADPIVMDRREVVGKVIRKDACAGIVSRPKRGDGLA